jgi:hypothetical protein
MAHAFVPREFKWTHRMIKVKGKGKVHLQTGHDDPEYEQQLQEPNPLYALSWEAQQTEPRHSDTQAT